MRRDAIHRAQEMQRRARPGGAVPPPGYSGSAMAGQPRRQEPEKPAPKPEPAPPAPAPEQAPEQATEPAPPAPEAGAPPPQDVPAAASAPAFFEALFADKERNLILGILLLLMEEKSSDPSLLFALLYLLL